MIHLRGLLSVVLASSLLATPAFAGSASDPEIRDDQGDVDVQHLVDAGVVPEDAASEELATSGDVTKAWIDKETRDSFTVAVELADVPDDENVSSPLAEVWAHFTIREGNYHARASLGQPTSGEPVQASYNLYLDETKVGELTGGVDVDADRVTFRVPKADVRDPGEGDELSSFHVTTHVPESGAALDYAPGAKETNLAEADPGSADPTDVSLAPTPSYGDVYAFQDLESPSSRITVDVTPESLEIEAGQQESFAVRIVNDADEPDEASLSLSNTPPGWSARLDPSTVTVPATGSETATLYVTPADDAEGHELLDVQVVTELGADKGATVSVIAVQSGDDGAREPGSGSETTVDEAGDEQPSSNSEGSEEATEESQAKQEADSIPAPSAALALASLAGLAAVLRRRP